MIPEKIYTNDERKSLAEFLEEFQRVCFNENIDLADFVDKKAPPKIKEELTAYLIKTHGTDRQAISDKTRALEIELKNVPVIHVTIAYDIDYEGYVRLTGFIRSTMQETVFVEFLKNEKIGGGAIIEGKERIGTYTLMEYFDSKAILE